jgi:hypothetical protein
VESLSSISPNDAAALARLLGQLSTTATFDSGRIHAIIDHQATELLVAYARKRRVVLCRRLLGIGPNPSTKDAELIAFRVGENHPRRVTLPDIGTPGTE